MEKPRKSNRKRAIKREAHVLLASHSERWAVQAQKRRWKAAEVALSNLGRLKRTQRQNEAEGNRDWRWGKRTHPPSKGVGCDRRKSKPGKKKKGKNSNRGKEGRRTKKLPQGKTQGGPCAGGVQEDAMAHGASTRTQGRGIKREGARTEPGKRRKGQRNDLG